MNIFLQTHIVKKGETLEQIAEMYHIPDLNILKDHHYLHTPDDSNHLGPTLFVGQEIFIPDQKEIEHYILRKKQVLEERTNRANNLIENGILLPIFNEMDEKIQFIIQDFLDDILQNTSEFEVRLKYLEKEEQLFTFLYQKKLLTVNGEKAEMKAYELALKCSACLYPAGLEIDLNRKIHDIKNYHEILKRWKTTQHDLLKTYTDENSIAYIEEVRRTIEVKNELIKAYQQDLFLQTYFYPYFKKYTSGKNESNSRYMPERILYKNQHLLTIAEDISVTLNAECIDDRSQQEILNHLPISNAEHDEDELLESKITGNFHLSKQHKLLQQADIIIDSYFYNVKETAKIELNLK
ncbi:MULTISPECIES: LysM peptidoglycan-binding domain-containing protein [unclassified Chryseobacterium]|uniref:LysM peptidoglycan-binding domain-containing protein n=1 Tax=unclassified Chryseobacterium TaxID=2593645 RepID=UPI00226A80E5|nr:MULTISPECIES: LysM peptidoglycan-binding domain-containing protein [unclassified Chryseobacterium]